MDISSRYLSLLKRPSLRWPLYCWQFLRSIRRVGKAAELLSFARWEIGHRVGFYRVSNQYVSFTNAPYLRLTNQPVTPHQPSLDGPFLRGQGLCFSPVPIDWKFCLTMTDGTVWGSCFSSLNQLVYSEDESESSVIVYTFERPIMSLFINSRDALFVCSDGRLFKSTDRGCSFQVILRLSTPISYFLFNGGMTELPDQTLLLGEYGSIWHGRTWQNMAYVYQSRDGGETWQTADFLRRQGVNKHVHIVRYSPLLNAVFLTDGDNKKQLWINPTLTHFDQRATKSVAGWNLLNQRHHKLGGYTSIAETDEAIIFGSDYLGGTNFMVRTTNGRQFEKLVLPDPYRRSPIMHMVSRQTQAGVEIWAASYSCLAGNTRSLLMYSQNSGRSWSKVIDFDGKHHEVRIAGYLSSDSWIRCTCR